MNRTRPRVFVTVMGATAALATASLAGAPVGAASLSTPSARGIGDGWTKLTASGLGDTAQIALARGRDGVLHVLWRTGGLPGTWRIWDTPVRAQGTVGTKVAATPRLNVPNAPDIVATPQAIDAFWGDENSDVYRASRPLSGGAWHADLSRPVLTGDGFNTDMAAAVAVDGAPWIGFVDPNDCGGLCVDRVGSPQVHLAVGGGCCLSSPALAVDGLRRTMWLGYVAARGSRNTGLYVQKLTSAGKSAGPAIRLPDTSSVFSLDQRMSLTGRGDGRPGVFAAYTGSMHGTRPCTVHVVRLGAAKAQNLGLNSACDSATFVADDPNGRLWVLWGVWSFHTGLATLYFRRSNPAATAWGPLEHVSFPRNLTIWSVYASAQAGRIDVAALVSPGYEFVTRQITVRLGLSARASGRTVIFQVTDQGTPVRGSTIRFCGATKTTGTSGRASFTIRRLRHGRATASAAKASYQAAQLTIRATC